MKIIEKEFNVLTGEETITERDETAMEKLKREQQEAEYVAAQAEAELKATAKAAAQAKLAALGLTLEDLQALGL